MIPARQRFGRGKVVRGSLAAVALAFFLLAVSAAIWPRLPGDLALALVVQAAIPTLLMPLLRAVALLGEAVVAIPLTLGVAVLMWLTGRRSPALLVALTLLPDGANFLIKEVIGRPRPDHALLLLEQSAASGLSFPSGHAVHFVVFFGLLALALPDWWPLTATAAARRALLAAGLALILLAGLSRVALGVHWPSDVLGGYLLGLLYLSGFLALHRRLHRMPAASPPPPPNDSTAQASRPGAG